MNMDTACALHQLAALYNISAANCAPGAPVFDQSAYGLTTLFHPSTAHRVFEVVAQGGDEQGEALAVGHAGEEATAGRRGGTRQPRAPPSDFNAYLTVLFRGVGVRGWGERVGKRDGESRRVGVKGDGEQRNPLGICWLGRPCRRRAVEMNPTGGFGLEPDWTARPVL